MMCGHSLAAKKDQQGVHELSRTTVLTSVVNLYKIWGTYLRHQILHLTEHIDHQREIAGVQRFR